MILGAFEHTNLGQDKDDICFYYFLIFNMVLHKYSFKKKRKNSKKWRKIIDNVFEEYWKFQEAKLEWVDKSFSVRKQR
jgi:hypothetical protein